MALSIALLAVASCAASVRASSCGLALPPSSAPLGALAARPALFSPPSRWSVGGETLDRGFTNYSAWAPYLGPLGATAVRLQAGWARCEPRGDGVYVWSWLDEVVDGALAVGVEPWLQLSFGNAAYGGGGSASVGSPLPAGAVALAAWDAWSRAVVERFAPRLARGGGTWEIWNEPNIQHINATAYADFALRTAATVRAAAPLARIRVGVLAGTDATYAAAFAARVAQTPGGGALFDEFTYHPYDYNPDASYAGVAALRAALDAGGLAQLPLAQGENGAPSVGGGYGALTQYNWTECSQAKWFARRLLGDGARGIPSSAFSIIDLCYEAAGAVRVNHKGLVAANCSAAGFPALGPKAAYATVQHVFGAVDGSFTAAAPVRVDTDAACDGGAVLFAGAWTSPRGELLFALWNATGTPLDAAFSSTATCDINLTISAPQPPPNGADGFAGVDVVTGAAFGVAGGLVEGGAGVGPLVFSFRALPVSDAPLLLAPLSALRLVPAPPAAGTLPRAADVAAIVEPLLDAFEAAHATGDAHWERAAFFFGLSSALALPLARDHAPYALAWAAANNFSCGGSQWPGDLGIAYTVDALVKCGAAPPASRAPLAALMAAEAVDAPRYDWSWVDTLAFNLPEWLAFAAALAKPEWTAFAGTQFRDARDGLPGNASAPGLWSAAHGLWWRDAAARAAVSPNGAPVFWARGNGWAALALVRALELRVLPDGDALRAELEAMLAAMAAALAPLQGVDGLWRASLLDADVAPNAEASGSGAFLALFAFGIRTGLLPRATYAPVVARAWAGLVTILVSPDASHVGFCQPVGAAPAPATAADTSDFCLGLVVAGAAQVWALVNKSASMTPARTVFSLGVGTNLGNTLEAPLEGGWAPAAQEVFFDDFKAAKFATVRIPVRWDNHTMNEPPYTVNATWMARVQTVVGWCTARGFQCIINSHWDTWLDTNSSAAFAAALPRFSAIWTQVATAFVDAPATLYFESFNEPHEVDVGKLNAFLTAFYTAVRPLHPTRPLILGWLNYMGPSWIEEDHHANWDAMVIPTLPNGAFDPNLAVETHSYDPYDVCGHPTRPWNSEPSDLLNMDFMFKTLSNWSATHNNMPVFMGESGCIRKQNQSSRVAWYTAFFEHVQTAPGVAGGLVWDDDGEFCIYNRSTRAFDVEVLRAIGL